MRPARARHRPVDPGYVSLLLRTGRLRETGAPGRRNFSWDFGFGEMTKTEGGEALLQHEDRKLADIRDYCNASRPQGKRWYALWTHSHCERLVRDQLGVKGFELFLPMIGVWSRRAGVRRRILRPMFPGYLFLCDALTGGRYAEVLKARGLVGVLSRGQGGPAAIPENEIDAIRALVRSELPALPHPYLKTGQRVRIRSGPLADVEGVLVDHRPPKGLLVLSVHLFRRSVAVEVDSALAEAA
ncbi:MAG TPA: transcription termination/antitermination NusG family protein [Nitrospira sp.]|nr:transcription termination/antitermination NusG family protein [Nitrospira sp.]